MVRALALATLVAVTGGGYHGGLSKNGKFAALRCASPRLPAAILSGANAAVSDSVDAAPLSVVTVQGGATPLTLAVADEPRSRELGLMCVTGLNPDAGMIFVFSQPSEYQFWMKNTVAPLDMLWVAPDGTVADVAANVPASTLTADEATVARRSGHGQFVIELRAGEAARDQIGIGTHLGLPHLHASS